MSGKFRPARKVERLSDCLEPLPGEIEMAVKMRPTYTWTKRPRGALLQLGTEDFILTVEHRRESAARRTNNGIPLFEMEKSDLRLHKNTGEEHCLVGSLTGAVASKSVTEAYKGWLTLNGNQGVSCKRGKPA